MRRLLRSHGFTVAPSRIQLHGQNGPLTDIDLLAFKDGIFFVLQLKYLPERTTYHERWKAEQTLTEGIRQCLGTQSELARRPALLKMALPNISSASASA